MTYEAWTWQAVEDRVLEAAETLMLLPAVKGPRVYGNAMPAVVRDWLNYGSEPSRYTRRPSREAIGRMPETWGWINAFLTEHDRKLVYAWAWMKVRRGRTVNDFASREGMNVRTLRRVLTAHFQHIAVELNRLHVIRLKMDVDALSEITAEIDPESVSSVTYDHWHREPDAKPAHDPEADTAGYIERVNQRREKEQRKAARRKAAERKAA